MLTPPVILPVDRSASNPLHNPQVHAADSNLACSVINNAQTELQSAAVLAWMQVGA